MGGFFEVVPFLAQKKRYKRYRIKSYFQRFLRPENLHFGLERENKPLSVSAEQSPVSAGVAYSKIPGKAEELVFKAQSCDVGSVIKR